MAARKYKGYGWPLSATVKPYNAMTKKEQVEFLTIRAKLILKEVYFQKEVELSSEEYQVIIHEKETHTAAQKQGPKTRPSP